jgi:hypothetical protein
VVTLLTKTAGLKYNLFKLPKQQGRTATCPLTTRPARKSSRCLEKLSISAVSYRTILKLSISATGLY